MVAQKDGSSEKEVRQTESGPPSFDTLRVGISNVQALHKLRFIANQLRLGPQWLGRQPGPTQVPELASDPAGPSSV